MMSKNKWEYFTLFLFFTSFIGSRLVQIEFGNYNITPYRLACVVGLFYIPISKKIVPRKSVISSYYIFLISWILYSFILFVFVTPDKTGFWETFFFLLCGTISTYYIGTYVRDIDMLKKCFATIEIASIIPFLFAFYEIFVGEYLFVSSFNADYYSLESAAFSSLGMRVPISTFTNPNDFSFMILAVVVSSFILYKTTSNKKRYFHLAMFIISLFLVLAAQSRAAFISVLICFCIIFCFKYSDFSKSRKRRYIAMLPLFIAAILWIYSLYQDIIEPLIMLELDGGSDQTRTNLIRNGFAFLESSYYFGVGLGNIEYYMLHYPVFYTGDILNIHNWWLEILVSSGIGIFSWYIILYLKLYRRINKCIKLSKKHDYKYVYVLSLSFLFMFAIDSMSSSSVARIESWVIMALMFAIPNLNLPQDHSTLNAKKYYHC